MKFLRAGFRFILALFLFLRAWLDYVLFIKLRGQASSLEARAAWLQKWSRRLLRIMGFDVQWEGTPPAYGLMVSNHLSYADVFVYASICPLIFVSKSEVKSWPIAGTLTQCAGTLYIVRQNKADVKRLGADMAAVVNAGMVVVLFLEGTSSDGSTVLPFRSSLLASAEEHGWPVTPACIHYTLQDGTMGEDVCYWGDMTFATHFVKLLTKKRVHAHARFGALLTEKAGRKELAQELYRRVCVLKQAHAEAEKHGKVESGTAA